MKLTIVIAGALLVGTPLGFLAGTLNSNRALAQFYSVSLTEMAVDARQLALGEGDDVLARKQAALPGLAMGFDSTFRRYMPTPQQHHALWSVSRFYADTKTPIPAPLQPLLTALPPRPLTECERLPETTAPVADETAPIRNGTGDEHCMNERDR